MVLKLVLSRAMNSSLHTQFARIGSCTFLSWSRADGEDSGLPEECLGRGTESVDPTLLVGAFTDFTGLPSGSRNSPGFRTPSSRWMGQKVFVPPSFFQTEKNLSEHLLNDSRNRFYSAWTVRFQPSGLVRVLQQSKLWQGCSGISPS